MRSATWSPDGTRIATACADNPARVWDAMTGAEQFTIPTAPFWVRSVTWSPDGTRIVTASADGTARIWDAMTGNHLLTLSNQPVEIQDARWSPDGTQIVTASADGTVKIWGVWRTKEDLIAYASQCCAIRELTSVERAQFNLSR